MGNPIAAPHQLPDAPENPIRRLGNGVISVRQLGGERIQAFSDMFTGASLTSLLPSAITASALVSLLRELTAQRPNHFVRKPMIS